MQADTVLVAANGSFSEHHFVLYSLPNQAFAELPDAVSICDASHPCVLYVGENQEDFTQPKLFSGAFTIVQHRARHHRKPEAPQVQEQHRLRLRRPCLVRYRQRHELASISSAATMGSAQAAGGSLAFTGVRALLVWLVWIGSLLFLLGSVGRRLVGRQRA